MKFPNIKSVVLKKENMVVIALIGVLLLVIAIPTDSLQSPDMATNKDSDQSGENGAGDVEEGITDISEYLNGYTESMERKTEEFLACMEGVGKVKVMITLAASSEFIVEKDIPVSRNTMTENDGSGGSRVTSDYENGETTVYTVNENGDKIPYVIKTLEPTIEGVTVVAEGGDNAVVQKNISEVIGALFHIEIHKIRVVKMKS